MNKMRFTPNQTRILRALDGATSPVEFNGTDKRSLDVLKRMGLVVYRESRKSSPTYYYPAGSVMVLHAALTKDGFNFIYTGGLDH